MYHSLICAHPDRGLFASQRSAGNRSGCLALALDSLGTEAGGPLRRFIFRSESTPHPRSRYDHHLSSAEGWHSGTRAGRQAPRYAGRASDVMTGRASTCAAPRLPNPPPRLPVPCQLPEATTSHAARRAHVQPLLVKSTSSSNAVSPMQALM